MDLQASAGFINGFSPFLAAFAGFVFGLGSGARRTVPGSYWRWLLGGIYRTGMVLLILNSGFALISALIKGQPLGVVIHLIFLIVLAWLWRRWAKYNDDDDFWNSLGQRMKKGARRLASALSSGGRKVSPVHG